MDYTPSSSSSSSYKGNIIAADQYHHHNQELEWMSRMPSSSSNTNTSSTTRIEVLDEDDEGGGGNKSVIIEREHMFDKVVTPSDVGKLNRLVIPKQHAEKYFPLDSSNNEKGLLLNFEDRTGKPWRFRYSYWNSSQSYVMTKGWSRFVKEKKLDAGDIVSFQRGVGDVGKDKLFIDWRRRPDGSGLLPYPSSQYQHHGHHHSHGRVIPGTAAWGTSSPGFVLRSHPHPHQHNPYPYPPLGLQRGVWDQQSIPPHSRSHLSTMSLMNVLPSSSQSHHHNPVQRGPGLGSGGGGVYGNVVNPYPVTGSLIFLRSSTPTNTSGVLSSSVVQQHGGGNRASLLSSSEEDHHDHHHHQGSGSMVMMQVQGEEGMVYESVPVVQGKAAAKRLRLFGVNMDCPISHQTHDFDILSSSLASSSTLNHHPHHHHHQHDQQHVTISMGLPSSSLSQSYSNSSQPLSSFYNGTSSSVVPLQKGKSSTSSPMSLDLDI